MPLSPPAQSAITARSILTRHLTAFTALAVVALIFVMAFIKGGVGAIGSDSDDIMRLVQIRDFLGGQSWFDTGQYRLGPDGGTDMHWSRLPDVPIILLTYLFDIFTTQPRAVVLAYSVWPPLSAAIVIGALAQGARFIARDTAGQIIRPYAPIFTLALTALFVVGFYRFKPGAIDHHNVQMGLVALSLAFACDLAGRFRSFFIAGGAIALSIAVGVEVYIFAAVICAYVALNWLIAGQAAARAAQGFGIGLSAGLGLAFVGTISPAEYTVVNCDALSLITVMAGCVGGLGLALSAKVVGAKAMPIRLLALVIVGGACLIVLLFQAPQCLDNPLNALPETVDRIWLSNVGEAKPLSLRAPDALTMVPYVLGAPVLALCLLILDLMQARKAGTGVWGRDWLLLMLIMSAVVMTVYQIRFSPFAYLFSVLPLAVWTGGIYRKGRARVEAHKAANSDGGEPSNIAYLGALALSVPLVWLIPGLLMAGDTAGKTMGAKASVCYEQAVMIEIAQLPTGLIAATSNGGAPILQHTNHRALSGNYHRNIAGIGAQIDIATRDDALPVLRELGVDYVHFCNPSRETDVLIDENPSGLYGQIKAGTVPPYLTPVLSLKDGVVTVYKVTP